MLSEIMLMRMPLVRCWTRGSALPVLAMITTIITIIAVIIAEGARETKVDKVLEGNQGETHTLQGRRGSLLLS